MPKVVNMIDDNRPKELTRKRKVKDKQGPPTRIKKSMEKLEADDFSFCVGDPVPEPREG